MINRRQVGITEDEGLWHNKRGEDGLWQTQFGDVKGQSGNPGKFISVSCAEFDGVNELVGLTTDGNIWSTTRNIDGWGQFKDLRVSAASPGNFTAIDCAYAYGDFCLYGVVSSQDI